MKHGQKAGNRSCGDYEKALRHRSLTVADLKAVIG